MRNTPRLLVGFAAATTLSIVIACGSDAGTDGSSSGTDGTSSGTSGSSDGFGSSSGGSSGTSGMTSGGNCFAPVDMYIMFDKSGSMNEPQDNQSAAGDCNIGQSVDSKWCRAINALSGYFNSPQAKDQGAALQLFSGNGPCNGGALATPATPATDYTTLPSASFDGLLNSTVPNGGTPTEGAIRGLSTFTAANRRPGRVTIGILITDGNPQSCNTNLTFLSNLLQQHFTATTIRTYVIGMNGATFDNLEEIAQGGNAPPHAATVGALTNACGNVPEPCRFWNVGDGNPQGFIAALAAIQQSADGCNPGGGTVNPPK